MKIYCYEIKFNDLIGDIEISNIMECDADKYSLSNHPQHKKYENIFKQLYLFQHNDFVKVIPIEVINNVAFPTNEGRLTKDIPLSYHIFTDSKSEEHIKLFRKLIFTNSFRIHESIYGLLLK